ncbi:DnaB-like helicase C-terminal domain-containing protein, partial [Streptomyces caeruleatus]
LESREDKRPTLNDLRESGDIEQDADVVIMAFRESYYLERRQPVAGTPEHAVWQTSTFRARNRLELLIEKQRGGPTGAVEVFCNIGCNAVRNL